jgi:hypothetical protein
MSVAGEIPKRKDERTAGKKKQHEKDFYSGRVEGNPLLTFKDLLSVSLHTVVERPLDAYRYT